MTKNYKLMTINIKQLSEDRFTVNGKLVHKDMDGNWIGNPDMTTKEVSFFQNHIINLTDQGT